MAITVHNSGDISKVPQTRKINNKSLDADITLSASDVGAIAKVSSSTEGNLPILTTSGELTDSGKQISDIGIIAVFNSTTYEEIKEAYENSTPVICFYDSILTTGGKVEYRLHALTDETAIFVGMESAYSDLTVDFLLCSSSSEWTVDYAHLLPAAQTTHKGYILAVNNVGDWQITAPPFLNTVSNTTENHIPAFDANGQLVDSGKAATITTTDDGNGNVTLAFGG